ncbi:hypothetical protein [Nocardia asiatica]|uniref:hypothetical protein n=1 Tax=Nocardia asiatica TaxID=209252 RepID=UPI0003130931|nr:hypothetical protein [Nocardia asiatica]
MRVGPVRRVSSSAERRSDELGAEWDTRLRPTSLYAGFEVLYDHLDADEEHSITGYLTDPTTDTPVVRLASGIFWPRCRIGCRSAARWRP